MIVTHNENVHEITFQASKKISRTCLSYFHVYMGKGQLKQFPHTHMQVHMCQEIPTQPHIHTHEHTHRDANTYINALMALFPLSLHIIMHLSSYIIKKQHSQTQMKVAITSIKMTNCSTKINQQTCYLSLSFNVKIQIKMNLLCH